MNKLEKNKIKISIDQYWSVDNNLDQKLYLITIKKEI